MLQTTNLTETMICKNCKYLLKLVDKENNGVWLCFKSYSPELIKILIKDLPLSDKQRLDLLVMDCKVIVSPTSHCARWEKKDGDINGDGKNL